MMLAVLLLVPSDPLTPRRPDEHFAPEADAARDLGIEVALVDHVKSAKHDWHEAAYIPDTSDTAHAEKVGRRLLELRGDDFTGGFVAREYEDLTGPEVRTWWIDGTCRLATAHPDTPEAQPDPGPGAVDPAPYAAAVAALGAPFVTVDLVRRADGAWRIVEIGDGQVSDRPATTPAATLVAALAGRGTEEMSWRP